MQGVGIGVRLVAIGLPRLRQQDQRCGVRGLQAEREIQEDERVEVEVDQPDHVRQDPHADEDRLPDEEGRRPEETREALRPSPNQPTPKVGARCE